MLRIATAAAFLAFSSVASAGNATIDWSRGVVTVRRAAHGNARSPSPAVARVDATKRADRAARNALVEAVLALPDAGGSTVEARGPEVARRVRQRVGGARVIDRDLASDGSVALTLLFPIDEARTAIHGNDRTGKAGPAAIVVDAGAVDVTPSVGLVLRAGTATYRGPTLWVRSKKAARAHHDGKAPSLRAHGHADGILEVPESKRAVLEEAAKSTALVIVVHP